MGAQGTRATEAVRRASVVHAVHEYEHGPGHARRGGAGWALDAVAALGVPAARVCKTIVVAVDGRPALALVPADAEVDCKAVAAVLGGRRADLVAAGEAERLTGYVTGGISPLGTRRRLPLVLDGAAAAEPTIHVSAGRRGLEIELAPGELLRLTGGRTGPIARRG